MIDEFKAAVFIAAFLINRQAVWILIIHAATEYAQLSPLNGFDTALAKAVIFSLSAAYITLKSEIRQVLVWLSWVSWWCAVDILIAPGTVTLFSSNYSTLINILDFIIIYHLFTTGGLNVVGSYSRSGHHPAFNLYLPKAR
jgi:hypothetical protein